MYRFGPQDEAHIKLLRKLFYLNNDGRNFTTMQNPTEVATYLTPEMLGELIGILAKSQQDDNKDFKGEALSKKIETIIEPIVPNIDKAFQLKLKEQKSVLEADEKEFKKLK